MLRAINGHDLTNLDRPNNYELESVKFVANMDLFVASREFSPESGRAELKLGEIEVSRSMGWYS